ncbi:MAG: Crp/Fnr family transcriptional regulator [Longimicrobiales bacterium]
MSSSPAAISALPLFSGLDPAAVQLLASGAVERSFPKGTVFWKAGARPRGLFVIIDGRVRVVRTAGGKQYTLHTEGAGGTLGEVPLFGEGVMPATALAARDTRCLIVAHDVLRAAMGADPELALRLLKRMADRVRTLLDRLDHRTATTVTAGLCALLLDRHAQARGGVFTLGATQTEVAEELGTVREVVVRALRQLRHAGLIESAGRAGYRVRNERALQEKIQ